MRSDQQIREEVQETLDQDPKISARDIAVAVRNGVVTLAGFVRAFGEKSRAEADARRVAGVLGIANDIEVRLLSCPQTRNSQNRGALAAAIAFGLAIVTSLIVRLYV